MLTGDSVVGYVRVSTEEQGISGAGLAAQRAAVEAECGRRGWHLVEVYEEVASAKSVAKRPQLAAALAAIERGEARGLVVTKVDRLSRSVLDFGVLLTRAQKKGWNLCVLELGFDLSTPMGEAMAQVVAVFAQLERRLIGQRTKEALVVKKAQGVRLGRPRAMDPAVRARIFRLRRKGLSLRGIVTELNAAGLPTAQGGRCWHLATVRKVLASKP